MMAKVLQRAFSSFKVKLPEFHTYKLDQQLFPTETETSVEQLTNYLKNMITIRRIEITSDGHYKNKNIRGFCHLADGQEAIYVGMEEAFNYEDCIISAYRDHGTAFMRGITTRQIFAEMFGRKTGSSKGKGGSMHYYSGKNNFYGGNGIVGAQIPVGAGLAYALKANSQNNIAAIMFGDGAANQGQLYEAANMAKIWNLPALFICENNLYGMGTSVSRSSANIQFYTRGDAIPGLRIDALNILAVREGLKVAKEYAIQNGPLFIELMCYRYHGHSMSDPGISYRTRDEVTEFRGKKDCIETVKKLLIERGVEEKELKSIEKGIRQEVDEEAKNALNDPWPEKHELFNDIYAPGTEFKPRNVERLQNYQFQVSQLNILIQYKDDQLQTKYSD